MATPPSAQRAMVRSVSTAIRIPGTSAPFDTAHLRIFHPALFGDTPMERNTGMVPVDPAALPLPVVVFHPGVNVWSGSYRWLAEALVSEAQVAVVLIDHVAEVAPGVRGVSAGVEVDALTPNSFGTQSVSQLLDPVMEALSALTGPLAAEHLDLDKPIVFGHSAGGTVALLSAGPTVAGVFAVGAHVMASTMLGWAPGSVLPIADGCPVMLVTGGRDGVIAASAARYGSDGSGHDPVGRTVDESLAERSHPSWHWHIADATHLLPVHPEDDTSARGFLEAGPGPDADMQRRELVRVAAEFVDFCSGGRAARGTAEPSGGSLVDGVLKRVDSGAASDVSS